jgi:DNA-binding IclR family transcriptional regulator
VLDRVRPALEELRDGARETVLFGKFRDPNTVVYLEVLSAPQSIRYSAEAGETRPAYANSMGRALLSTLAPEARRKLLAATPLAPLTDATRTTPEAIEQELERSPARGWYGNLSSASHGRCASAARPMPSRWRARATGSSRASTRWPPCCARPAWPSNTRADRKQ